MQNVIIFAQMLKNKENPMTLSALYLDPTEDNEEAQFRNSEEIEKNNEEEYYLP